MQRARNTGSRSATRRSLHCLVQRGCRQHRGSPGNLPEQARQTSLMVVGEDEGQSVPVDAPHDRFDIERRSVGRVEVQLSDATLIEALRRPHLGPPVTQLHQGCLKSAWSRRAECSRRSSHRRQVVTSGVARSRAGVIGSPHSSQLPSSPPRSRSSASASVFASSTHPRGVVSDHSACSSKAPKNPLNTTSPSMRRMGLLSAHPRDDRRHCLLPCCAYPIAGSSCRSSIPMLTARPNTAYWTLVQSFR
jgi:hypothetical protein